MGRRRQPVAKKGDSQSQRRATASRKEGQLQSCKEVGAAPRSAEEFTREEKGSGKRPLIFRIDAGPEPHERKPCIVVDCITCICLWKLGAHRVLVDCMKRMNTCLYIHAVVCWVEGSLVANQQFRGSPRSAYMGEHEVLRSFPGSLFEPRERESCVHSPQEG